MVGPFFCTINGSDVFFDSLFDLLLFATADVEKSPRNLRDDGPETLQWFQEVSLEPFVFLTPVICEYTAFERF